MTDLFPLEAVHKTFRQERKISTICYVCIGEHCSMMNNMIGIEIFYQKLLFLPGDKILITANNPEYNLVNGDTATIEEIYPDGEIQLTNGRMIPADFESILYGYATTSHKSQGSTCDHAILAAVQMDNRACYVGSSRGRQSVKVFTPDFEHLYDSIKRNSEQLTGHDMIAVRQKYMDISTKQIMETKQEREILPHVS